jgi:hypothetical protein
MGQLLVNLGTQSFGEAFKEKIKKPNIWRDFAV